ncbi:predicted protein [Ostreococcus lucimarinus CCE9901]|uniref:J domain-containing protein n=1 Tax=Ostreococcus lucimarinus (strain CCE9901) TaxID=436017 RepID=A4S171_OSTLU|nr:predicted protein [Ostreococcus lucimarinus CCE9901]ABO97606.1 predicted protein [Ostreococcus lucimarinus CCE9901]|eukprot:XP_001419313.1 predicted protein [Ostreococcus lucimarinus CCE9901]
MSRADDASTSARDLYAALGVARDAEADEIKRAYRKLAAALHPDKQPRRRRDRDDDDDDDDDDDAGATEAAQRAFAALSEAYEVLSDADARRTYDAYGMDGVRAGRELGARGKTTEEMRIEYERRRAKETKEAAEARLNHSGTYVFGFSAAHLMEESIARRRAAFTNNPGLDLTSVSLQNSMEIPLSEEDAVYTVTQGTTRGGRGAGNFILGWRRAFSPLTSLDVSAQTGQTSAVTATVTRQLTTHTTGAVSHNYIAQQGFGLQLMLQRQLFAQTRGHLTWNVGPVSSMSTGATHAFGKNAVKCDFSVGVAASGLNGHFIRQMDEKRVYRVGWKLGTAGAELDVGATKQVDEDTALGASIVVSLRGLSLRFRVNRQGQRFVVPILLTPMVTWRKSLLAFTLPPIAIALLRHFVARPIMNRYIRKRQLAAREKNKRTILVAMREAHSATKMIAETADKKARAARERGGLVIESAVFGAPDAPKPAASPPPYVDVTRALQFMVDNDTLDLYENVAMCDLLGFCDPCPGEDKHLRVRYRYRRALHEVTVKADAMVSLPSADHRLPEKLQTIDPRV